jgi:hypothetical protein
MPSLPLRRYEDIIQERQNKQSPIRLNKIVALKEEGLKEKNLSSTLNFEMTRPTRNQLVVWGTIKHLDLVEVYLQNKSSPSPSRTVIKLKLAQRVQNPINLSFTVKSSFRGFSPLKIGLSWAFNMAKLWQSYAQKKGTLWDSLRTFKNWGLRVLFLSTTLSTGAGVFLCALHILRIIPSMEKLVSLYGATAICLFIISLPLGFHRILKEKFYLHSEPGFS